MFVLIALINQIDGVSFWPLCPYSFILNFMSVRLFFVVFFFCHCINLTGQTIINAEQLILDGDSVRWSLQASYQGTSGNANTHEFSVDPGLMWVQRKYALKLFGSYHALFSGTQRVLNGGFLHARYARNIVNRGRAYLFYQLQFNEVLLMNKRELIGGGYRVEILHRDSLSDAVAIGVMHEYEVLDRALLAADEVYKTNYLRLSLMHSLNWLISANFSIDNVLYYQPYLMNFQDYRLLNDLRLSFRITAHLDLLLQAEFRFDRQPPTALKNYDLAIRSGLNLQW